MPLSWRRVKHGAAVTGYWSGVANAQALPAKWRAVLVAAAVAISGAAWGTPLEQVGSAHQDDGVPETMVRTARQVSELMEIEAAYAIERATYALETSGGMMGAASRPAEARTRHDAADADGLTLVAIYGVGKKLAAQVMDGTTQYLYRHGQAYPVGMPTDAPDANVYQLRGISGSCVVLARDQQAHTLCLHPDFRVDHHAVGRP